MAQFSLSNLQLRSNLLSEDYQNEMNRITAHEVKDVWRRCPQLRSTLSSEQQRAWTARLFDGDEQVSLIQGDRNRAWLEGLAERVEDAVTSLELRADEELAFEVLCVVEGLAEADLDSTYAARAKSWANRVRVVLGRPEFRLTMEMIDCRLTEFFGKQVQHVAAKPFRDVRAIMTASLTFSGK